MLFSPKRFWEIFCPLAFPASAFLCLWRHHSSLCLCDHFASSSSLDVCLLCFAVVLVVRNPPVNAINAKDVGSVSGSERSPGAGQGSPLQYSCLKNLMNRGAWRAMDHRIAKSETWLKRLSTHTCNLFIDRISNIVFFSYTEIKRVLWSMKAHICTYIHLYVERNKASDNI